MTRRPYLILCLLFLYHFSHADKVIMRDGKIYQGHIMGETTRSLLISNPPLDPKPRFLELKDVMTIVRESRPAEKPSEEETRFASVNAGLSGQAYSSKTFSFSSAPGLNFGGGFRIHPALELGGEFDFIPHLSGALTVQAGSQSRSYDSFYAYHGGFAAKFFPFFKKTEWRPEPYLTTGYHWNRLVPKDSGDALKGTSLFGGAGVLIPWWKPLYWDFRLLYEHTNYDSINFLGGQGNLSGVSHNAYTFSIGLSYRFL